MITKTNPAIQIQERTISDLTVDKANIMTAQKTRRNTAWLLPTAILSSALLLQQGCTPYPGSAYPGYYGTYPGTYQQYPQGYRPTPTTPNYQQPQTSPGNSYYPGYYPPGYSPVNPQPQAPLYQNNSYFPGQQSTPKYQQPSLPPISQENNNGNNNGIGYNQCGTYYDINYNVNYGNVYNTDFQALQCIQRN